MPSNADLTRSIEEIATEKGVNVPETKGKNNAELAEMLSGLKKPVEAEILAEASIENAKVVEQPPYTIAEGKALTSCRGILAEGEEVKAEDFPNGQKTIDSLVKSGHIVKA